MSVYAWQEMSTSPCYCVDSSAGCILEAAGAFDSLAPSANESQQSSMQGTMPSSRGISQAVGTMPIRRKHLASCATLIVTRIRCKLLDHNTVN